MNKKVVKNYLYNLSYQILVIIVPLITTPYLSRVLGPQLIGTYSYTNSITQYFILFGALGLNLYGQREIAYYQNDKDKYSKTFWEIFILKAISLILSVTLYFFMIKYYGRYTFIFVLQTIDIVAAIFDITWLFQGLEDFKKVVFRNFIVKILGVVFIFVFVKSSNDLLKYIFCNSLTIIFGNLSMWVYLPKIVKKIDIKKIYVLKHLKTAVALFIPQIAISLYTMLDKTMIGLLTNLEVEVAFYEQSQKIIKIALTIITSLGTVMLPRVANTFKLGDHNLVQKYVNESLQFVFFLGLPITFGMMAVSPNFVPWFFGNGYEKVILNMIIISPIIFFIGLSNVTGTQFLLPTNRQNAYSRSVVIGSITNFILNLLLIPKFLSYGATVATIIAEATVAIVQLKYVQDIIDIKELFIKNIRYLIFSFFMFFITISIGHFMTPSVVNTLIQIGIGLLVYIFLLLISKDKLINNMLRKLKK